jgi:hypothetical protein
MVLLSKYQLVEYLVLRPSIRSNQVKVITISFDLAQVNPGAPAYLDFAVNWSTPLWNPPLMDIPPLPNLVGLNEALYIMRPTLQLWNGALDAGHHEFCYVIPDYCPEWVSIDVQGFNFSVSNGTITHECMSGNPPPTGRCCYPDGQNTLCADNYECECLLLGGTWNGNLTCNTPCTTQIGACCMPDFTCLELQQNVCAIVGGTYQGDNTTCATSNCGPSLVGACCMPDGTCSELDAITCLQNGGTFQGVGISCASVSCPQPIGSCCMPDGTCQDMTDTDCANAGGYFSGIGTSCATAACPDIGACCLPNDVCTNTTASDCSTQGGLYMGDGTDCATNPCPQENNFWITVNEIGTTLPNPLLTGGTNYYPSGINGWVNYPSGWSNIWFYDHPYDATRWKKIHLTFTVAPFNAQAPSEFILAVNWSTPEWSLGPNAIYGPPIPAFTPTPAEEALYIERPTLISISGVLTQQYYDLCLYVPDYNPEWISIDVMGYNFMIDNGYIWHACLPGPPPITGTVSTSLIEICEGECANLSASGGFGYQWSNGSSSPTLSVCPSASTTYRVSITDLNGCMVVREVKVIVNPSPTVTLDCHDVSCNGFGDGFINATASGGTPPYSYAWSSGGGGAGVISLVPGTYTVTVTDSKGCTATASCPINEPSEVDIYYVTVIHLLCHGDQNGSIQTSVTGGTPPYSYAWSSGQSGANLSGLSGGTYILTVTDANGCTDIETIIVNEPPPLSISLNCVNITCFGDQDGHIVASVNGGTPGYSMVWSNTATGGSIANLGPGTYIITVTDANNCTATASCNITQPPAVNIYYVGIVNLVCHGDQNGSVSLGVNGGTPGYSYNWSNGASTPTITGLGGGIYSVTVTDSKGCTAVTAAPVTEPPALQLIVQCSDVTCFGDSDGSIGAGVQGGSPPYAYNWGVGIPPVNFVPNLSAGTYTVTVTDNNGCTGTASCTINQPPLLNLSLSCYDISCFGYQDGAIGATVQGGTPPVVYSWPQLNAGGLITGLSTGAYTVSVSDANGCTDVRICVIHEPPLLTASLNCTNVSCSGNNDGTATIITSGGTPPLSYTWSPNVSSGSSASNLAPGTYSVIVTDANGCTATDNCVITAQSGLSISMNCVSPTCFGYSDGSVTATVGGSGNLTYAWSYGNSTNNMLVNVPAGTYTVSVTDAFGCASSASCTVTDPPQLVVVLNCSDIFCNGDNNGSAVAGVTGGVTPYSFAWYSGQTTQVINNLSGGTYTVVVTDFAGCTASASCTIYEPPAITITLSPVNPICNGSSTGSVAALVGGGTGPYAYYWNGNLGGPNLNNLPAGPYTLQIIDSKGCFALATVTLIDPPAVVVSLSVSNISCYGFADGSIASGVTGGTPGYSYLWSNLATTPNIGNLIAGTYTVTVTDSNGCTGVASATVTEPAPLSVAITKINVSCYGGSDGSATATVNGGTGPYTYQWNGISGGPTNSNLSANTYSLVVIDSRGCQLQQSYIIQQPPSVTISIVGTDVDCYGNATGGATATAAGGTSPYTYQWSTGASGSSVSGLLAGTYTATATDAAGCTGSATVVINQPAAISLNTIGVNPSTTTSTDGSVGLTVTGGTSPYTYLWSTGASTQDISGLGVGTYCVTVTDANGCTATDCQTLIAASTCPTTNAFWMSMDIQGNPSTNPGLTGGIDYYPGGLNGWYEYLSGWWNIWFCNLPYDPNAYKEVTVSFDLIMNQPGYIKLALNWSTPVWDTQLFGLPPLPGNPVVDQNENLFIQREILLETNLASIGNGQHTFTYIIPYCPAWVSIDIQGYGFSVTNGVINHLCMQDPLGQCCYVEPATGAVLCDMLTQTACNSLNGYWDAALTCNDPCSIPPPWITPVPTGNNHSIFIPGTASLMIDGSPVAPGDYIGLFYDFNGNDICAGSILWDGSSNVMAAWGDDQQTPVKDGFLAGESFKWKVWDASDAIEYTAVASYDPLYLNMGYYADNGMSAILSLTGSTCQDITLPVGWSFASSYIDPSPPDMVSIFSDIVSNVTIVKNEGGAVYWPAVDVNLNVIGNWLPGEGYRIFMTTASVLTICGDLLDPAITPVDLPAGWSLFAYLCPSPQAIVPAMSTVFSDIIIIKSGSGLVYWPPFINQIQNMMPGEGYQAKMINNRTLYYQCASPISKVEEIKTPQYYLTPSETDNNMTIGLPQSVIEDMLKTGDEIGVFNESNQLVGSTVYNGSFAAISIWGDDEYTDVTEGMKDNEEFMIRIWNHETNKESVLSIDSWSEGGSAYSLNGISVAEKVSLKLNEDGFVLYQNTPNPFTNETEIKFYLPSKSQIELQVFNILGEKVSNLASGEFEQGIHSVRFDSSLLPAGTYFYRIKTPYTSATKKMNLIK